MVCGKISRLKSDCWVLSTVDHAMELAHMVEDKLCFRKQKYGSENKSGTISWVKSNQQGGSSLFSPRSFFSGNQLSPKSLSNISQSGNSTASSLVSTVKLAGDVRRLSERELQDKRAKG